MKAEEIKAKELHDKFYKIFEALGFDELPNKNAIQCAIISQQREVELLKRLNSAFYSSYLYLSLQEAKEVLTILKEM